MKVDEIRSKDDADLGAILDKTRKRLFEIRCKSATEEISNPAEIRAQRKTIARILTVLRERGAGVAGR